MVKKEGINVNSKIVYPIHIAFCVNDKYASYIAVTIKSIAENHSTNNVNIHILTDYMSLQTKKKLFDVIKGYDYITLEIHVVDDTSLRGLKDTWSIYTWYRVLLPQILPLHVHRVLYLDADTIVESDLIDLFSLNMENKSIGGVLDIESFNDETFDRCGYDRGKLYVCAGVMLINLDYWREYELTDKIIQWGREHNDLIKYPDQDTINYICQDTKIILPLRFGIINSFFVEPVFYQPPYREQLIDCVCHPSIIHYAGQAPWIKEYANHIMQCEWIKYNKMLHKPVHQYYMTKGWLFIKMMVWNVLHCYSKKTKITLQDIKQKLFSYDT